MNATLEPVRGKEEVRSQRLRPVTSVVRLDPPDLSPNRLRVLPRVPSSTPDSLIPAHPVVGNRRAPGTLTQETLGQR